MTNPISQQSLTTSGTVVAVDLIRILNLHKKVVMSKIAYINASIRPRYIVHGYACIFKAFKDNLKQLTLLRVHIRRLEVVDAEEAIIELAYVFLQEIATIRVDYTSPRCFGIVKPLNIKPINGYRALGRLLLGYEIPKVGG